MIVYPIGYQPTTPPTHPPTHPTTTQKPWTVTAPADNRGTNHHNSENQKLGNDDDFIMPKKTNNEESDYTDYGQSEEDLFFWKPGYTPPKPELSRVNPSSSESNFDSDDDAFEINVHQTERKI
uniref:Uncharacterized protein n=1 Tax=Panagrolaimus sp. JU765 TaxID=591449 RepID=A0AC34QFA3_9BILA